MSKIEDRLEKLEVDLAHANQTIDELNAVVIDQGRQLERVKLLLTNMTDQVEELMDSVAPGHQNEKPPHY